MRSRTTWTTPSPDSGTRSTRIPMYGSQCSLPAASVPSARAPTSARASRSATSVSRSVAVSPAWADLFASLRKPLVVAVQGYVLGAGFELAMCADIIVAASTAQFGLPEVKAGIIGEAGVVHRAVRQLPYRVAMALILTGDRLPADQALRYGLVNEVVPLRRARGGGRELGAAGSPPRRLSPSRRPSMPSTPGWGIRSRWRSRRSSTSSRSTPGLTTWSKAAPHTPRSVDRSGRADDHRRYGRGRPRARCRGGSRRNAWTGSSGARRSPLGDRLVRTAQHAPAQVALVFPDETYTYGELLDEAIVVARGLIALGVDRGRSGRAARAELCRVCRGPVRRRAHRSGRRAPQRPQHRP